MEPHAFAYLDDIIVIGRTFEEHMANLREVLRRLRAANLKINVEKCEFFKSETRYLGHIVTSEGIKTDPEKIAAIVQIPIPQDTKGVRRFLGITSWYRRFVPNFAQMSQPLTQLLKKGKHWKWGPEQQLAFEALKDCLTRAPVLACPDFSKTFTLQTDASDCGLGAVLTQEMDDGERVIAYASRHLNAAEKNYSTTEKECLAIVWGIRKMRPYLEGYEFKVITDHLSLKWLNSIDNPTGRLARWALELQQYQFTVNYRRGKQNVVADALSRHPLVEINLAQTHTVPFCPWYEGKLEAVRSNPEQHADYTIVNDKLYRHFTREINDEDSTPWKLCIPVHQRQQVLEETHDRVTGGHLGIRKTLNKVASRYYWPGMSRDVSRYVRQCGTCQRYKMSQQQPAGKMLTRIPNEPWSLVSADFIGPLPRTSHGNTMLLVIFDIFSKWVELIPFRKATAEGVVKALRERIVSRYGVPKGLITDNGSQFTSRVLKKYLDTIGVSQQFTAPYTPQENPTERANRTIKTMIAQFSGKRHNKWDELLPEIMLAINTSESESTGYSPAFLTQGRTPRLPKALYDEVTIGSGARCVSPSERAQELKEVFQIVQRNLEKAAQKQRHHYNLRHRNWKPKVGDQVLVRQHPLSKAVDKFAAKLAPKFGGPYIVTEFVSPVIVRLRAADTNEKRTAHLSELKAYHDNNQIFPLTLPRSSKQIANYIGGRMNSEKQRFEESRRKFQRSMEQGQAKIRRTIFLNDDEIPSTSSSRPRVNNNPHPTRVKPRAPTTQSAPKPIKRNTNMAHLHRITTVENQPQTHSAPTGHSQRCYDLQSEPIIISDDEDQIPPPPPLILTEDERAEVETTPEERNSLLDELHITLEDLNDPLIREFVQSYCGAMNDMDDACPEPPPSPSPTSSSSSIDWDGEDFRPPTPPRPRMYGSLDIENRQYQYLGMLCYERIWRARILIPGVQISPAQIGPAPPPRYPENHDEASQMGSPIHASTVHDVPITPGRGWLISEPSNADRSPEVTNGSPTGAAKTHNSASSPKEATTPPPSSPTHGGSVTPDQLPLTLQREIEEKRQGQKGRRIRYTRIINGRQYRITITRNGAVRITKSE